MDIETEAEGQPSRPRSHGKRSQMSPSSIVPSDAFQIILERIDKLQDVQNEQSDRLTTIQEQLNLLLAKFDSFTTKQQPFSHSGQKWGDMEQEQLLRGSVFLRGGKLLAFLVYATYGFCCLQFLLSLGWLHYFYLKLLVHWFKYFGQYSVFCICTFALSLSTFS